MLSPGQVKIRDLVMGPGTSYQILTDTNFFNRHVRADQSGARAWGHGTWSGVEFMDEAVVPLRISTRAADEAGWLALHQQLMLAFAPIGEAAGDVELRFAFGGSEYLLFGRPRMVEPDINLAAGGFSITRAAFIALDPRIYAGTETVASTGLPTFTNGVGLPLRAPFHVPGIQLGGVTAVTNVGTAESGLVLRIDGPVTEPRVTVQLADGSVKTVRFDVALTAGQWLDVDTAARTVLLNGVSSRRGQASGEFPVLPAGTHSVRFFAADYNTTALLTVRFRSSWW